MKNFNFEFAKLLYCPNEKKIFQKIAQLPTLFSSLSKEQRNSFIKILIPYLNSKY